MKNFLFFKTQIGVLEVVEEDNQIIKIDIVKDGVLKENTTDSKVLLNAKQQIIEYFSGIRKTFDLPINLKGTEFQKRVWSELIKINYGQTKTYKDIATALGKPSASRAIGNANNKNPILIVVPCHRVVGKNKELTGYKAGLENKNFLLNLEK